MRFAVVSLLSASALLAASPALAKPTAQDASFVASAGARALTEVNLSTALLHARGADRRVRRLASVTVKRAGHESRAIATLATRNHLPSARHGKRRGTSQVGHLAKLRGTRRDRSYLKLTISDLDSHIRAYQREIAKGHDAGIRKQARQWIGRLTDLRARARALLAQVR